MVGAGEEMLRNAFIDHYLGEVIGGDDVEEPRRSWFGPEITPDYVNMAMPIVSRLPAALLLISAVCRA